MQKLAVVVVVAVLALGGLVAWKQPEPAARLRAGAQSPATPEAKASPSAPAPKPSARPADAQAAQGAAPAAQTSSGAAPSIADGPKALLEVIVLTEEDGAPVARAQVAVRRRGDRAQPSEPTQGTQGSLEESVLTGAYGRGRFILPSGVGLELAVRHRAFKNPTFVEVPALGPSEQRKLKITVRSADASLVRGRVIEQASGAPIAGADVSIIVVGSTGTPAQAVPEPDLVCTRTETDSDGRFELPFAPWRGGVVRVDAEGYGRKLAQLDARLLAAEAGGTIALARGARLEVRAEGASRSPGAELVVGVAAGDLAAFPELESGAWRGSQFWFATFDESELAVRSDLPVGAKLWIAAREGDFVFQRSPTPLTLESGETRAVALELGSGARVRVDAHTPDGEVVEGVTLVLVPASGEDDLYVERLPADSTGGARGAREAVTDDLGRADFEELTPGDWLLVPRDPGASVAADQRVAPRATLVHVAPGDRQVRASLQIHRGVWLRGRVVAGDGAPREPEPSGSASAGDSGGPSGGGERVFLHSAAHAIQLAVDVKSDGTFEFGPLPAGAYELVAGRGSFARGEPVRVEAPADDVVVRADAGGWLRARLVDRGGAGVGAAQVLWSRGGAEGQAFGRWTEARGEELARENVALDTWDVVAITADGRIGVESVVATPSDDAPPATVTLVPGARLRLLHPPLTGRCVATRGTQLVGMAEFGRDAVPTLVVPPGKVRLTLVDNGEETERVIELDALEGELRDVDLALAR